MSASPTLVYGRPHAGLRGAKIHTFFQICKEKVQKKEIRLRMGGVLETKRVRMKKEGVEFR